MDEWLREALGLQDDECPFPWQKELLRLFLEGRIDKALDIPTGLGKTAVMAIWLVARACGAQVPRRLVYIVDRRVIVDQATEVAEGLRSLVARRSKLRECLGLKPGADLPISTLRGQYVDNRQWLDDPSLPAIVVGTVDMVGSRILFQGYGVSGKMRPYQAGLLGVDSLLVLDEAHLVPPFEQLLRFVVDDPRLAPDDAVRPLVPASWAMALSATARRPSEDVPFGLQAADLDTPEVRRRLAAVKRLVRHDAPHGKLPAALAAEAWRLAADGTRCVRCIVFSDQREAAQQARHALQSLAKKAGRTIQTEFLVGARRVFERSGGQLPDWLVKWRFLRPRRTDGGPSEPAPPNQPSPAFLFATSAGEVGIDLDADCLVCDVVAWERMIQRFGRVNRRGKSDASLSLVVEAEDSAAAKRLAKPKEDLKARDRELLQVARRRGAVLDLLDRLPTSGEGTDVSPGALRALALEAGTDGDLRRLMDAASTPEPLRPAATRPLVEAWAMTSLPAHSGRPAVAPWLRGWVQAEPETNVVWRRHLPMPLPARARDGRTDQTDGVIGAPDTAATDFFEAAPPHVSEILQTETYRVTSWLALRAAAVRAARPAPVADGAEKPLTDNDVVAWVLPQDDEPPRALRLRELAAEPAADAPPGLDRLLVGATLVVDARLGGLQHGLLTEDEGEVMRTADDGEPWLGPGVVDFRIRTEEESPPAHGEWHERGRFPAAWSDEGDPVSWLIVDGLRGHAATGNDGSAAGKLQALDDHQAAVEARAVGIAGRLGLPEDYREMLAAVAKRHDEGKRAACWQRAFCAPPDRAYAKTPGPFNMHVLGGYRHEFGSLGLALRRGYFDAEPADLRALALHLMVAHHGYGRPLISTAGGDDAPPSALHERAAEVALRFSILQERWGPHGLAWWEALLRAADQQASREPVVTAGAAGASGG